MCPEQVREEARKILQEMCDAKPGSPPPKLSYVLLARRLGTTAYLLKKLMLLDGAPPETVRWGRGRPHVEWGVSRDQIDWAVKPATLRFQVGCNMKARAKAFNLRFGT